MGALRFSQTRRRLGQILAAPRRRRERWTAAALVLLLLLTFIGSARLSREHFYPYPAYAAGEERAAGDFFAR